MAELLKQAQQMQQQLVAAQEEMARTEVTGTAGGGLVSATMTGAGELTALTIAPAAVDPDDLETLQDLIVAAVRDAKRAADELAAEASELMAERAADESARGDRDPEPVVDPEQAALSLLKAQLGAHPVDS